MRVKRKVQIRIFLTGMLLIFGIYYCVKMYSVKDAVTTDGIITRNYMHGINKSDFGNTISAEIKYYAGDSIITFLGPEGQPMDVGSIIPVIYNDNDKTGAQVYTFKGFWLDGLIWCLLPLIFWTAGCFGLISVRK